jgi:hypothetical protein
MALTAVIKSRMPHGNRWEIDAEVTFDSAYPAGGEPYTAGMFGLTSIDSITVSASPQGYVVSPDQVNKKLILYTAHGTPGATVALLETTTANQSATKAAVKVIGV